MNLRRIDADLFERHPDGRGDGIVQRNSRLLFQGLGQIGSSQSAATLCL